MIAIVIEDNAVTGASLAELLRGRGHVAEWAANMGAAELKAPVVRPDVVVLDLSLPDVAGPQDALERARALAGAPRVVILTALAASDLPPLRASSVLIKPADPAEIVRQLVAAVAATGEKPS